MKADELADVKQKLRDFAAANGMQWVLNEVDEAVSLGISEVRTLRQSTQQGRLTYEDVTGVGVTDMKSGHGRRRAEQFVRRRPLTDMEQVDLLVQALRRVLVDLDKIANETIEALNSPEIFERQHPSALAEYEDAHTPLPPPVSEISFAPDEGSNSPAIDTETIRRTDRSERASEVLAEIESELRS